MELYRIEWKNSAAKELRKLPVNTIPKLLKAVENLARNPFPKGVKKLVGTDRTFRIREGDYRIIYTIQEDIVLIQIIKISHRRDIYRNF